jgi:hypothetical protein
MPKKAKPHIHIHVYTHIHTHTYTYTCLHKYNSLLSSLRTVHKCQRSIKSILPTNPLLTQIIHSKSQSQSFPNEVACFNRTNISIGLDHNQVVSSITGYLQLWMTHSNNLSFFGAKHVTISRTLNVYTYYYTIKQSSLSCKAIKRYVARQELNISWKMKLISITANSIRTNWWFTSNMILISTVEITKKYSL